MMAVTWITWLEILRKRVFVVTLLMTIVFLGLYAFALHSLSAANTSTANTNLLYTYLRGAVYLSLGLYVSNFTVAYLSIFSSVGTISSEIENGLLLAILPRPVARWRVYLGKWLGYSVWSLLYGATMFWCIVWIGEVFTSFPVTALMLWKAFCVFELIPLILVSLSVFGSMYLPTLGNGVAITLLFGIGIIGGLLQRLSTTANVPLTLNNVGLVTSLLIPTNAIYYRVSSELMGGNTNASTVMNMSSGNMLGPFGGGPTPSNAFLIYTVAYIVAVTGFGMWRFSKRDI